MEQAEAKRRLCALVAVEAGDPDLVQEATEVLGGLVSALSGNDFILEFPTAANALTAAEAIMAGAPVPARIGLHFGEAKLGAGVAARLRQVAEPGEIIASDDLKRALPGALADRLQPVGRSRLARMREEGPLHSLRMVGARSGPATKIPSRFWPLLAGLAVLAATLALYWWLSPSSASDRLVVAVTSFQGDGGEGASPAAGAAFADRLASALADRKVPVVSRVLSAKGQLRDARLVLGGVVQHDGPLLRLRLRMDDAKSGRPLWSAALQRPDTESLALQNQAATEAAEMVVALRGEIAGARGVSPEVLAAFVQAVDLKRRGDGEAATRAYQRLVALAPKSSRAHSGLALSLAARRPAEAAAAARRALELDPRNAAAYLVLAGLAPDDGGREGLIGKAKLAEPRNPAVLVAEGDRLRDLGRRQPALVLYQQALARDPYRPESFARNIDALAALGREGDARALSRQASQLLPDFCRRASRPYGCEAPGEAAAKPAP